MNTGLEFESRLLSSKVKAHSPSENSILPLCSVYTCICSKNRSTVQSAKIMPIINDNVVRGRLSENYLTRKFIARNICDAKYSQFTVITNDVQ